MQKTKESPWHTIKLDLYKERILLEDQDRMPSIIIFKDNFNRRYIELMCFDDDNNDNFYYLVQEIGLKMLEDFLNGKIELKSILKSKNKLYKMTPFAKANKEVEEKIELIDSSFVDNLPWREDSYFLFNESEEEKEYLDKIYKELNKKDN